LPAALQPPIITPSLNDFFDTAALAATGTIPACAASLGKAQTHLSAHRGA
jgi:hypothetical protein